MYIYIYISVVRRPPSSFVLVFARRRRLSSSSVHTIYIYIVYVVYIKYQFVICGGCKVGCATAPLPAPLETSKGTLCLRVLFFRSSFFCLLPSLLFVSSFSQDGPKASQELPKSILTGGIYAFASTLQSI